MSIHVLIRKCQIESVLYYCWILVPEVQSWQVMVKKRKAFWLRRVEATSFFVQYVTSFTKDAFWAGCTKKSFGDLMDGWKSWFLCNPPLEWAFFLSNKWHCQKIANLFLRGIIRWRLSTCGSRRWSHQFVKAIPKINTVLCRRRFFGRICTSDDFFNRPRKLSNFLQK